MLTINSMIEDTDRPEFVSALRDFYITFPEHNIVSEEEAFEILEDVTYVEVTRDNVDDICAWIRDKAESAKSNGFKMGYIETRTRLYLLL